MSDGSALGDLVQALTMCVTSTGTARDAVMAAESEAGTALAAAQAYGNESDILETEALQTAVGDQAGVLAGLAKTTEDLLQRAVALQGGSASLASDGTSALPNASPTTTMAGSSNSSTPFERAATQASEAFEADDNNEHQRPRVRPMTTLAAGGSVASALFTAGGHILPPIIQIPLGTAVATVSAIPQVKEWIGQVRDVARNRKARRGKKGQQ